MTPVQTQKPRHPDTRTTALVFGGGLGLGAYHGGAFEALAAQSFPLDWVAGSSAGAITAALIAGARASERLAHLRRYWLASDSEAKPVPHRHLLAWLHAVNTHLLGHASFFLPKMPVPVRAGGSPAFQGLYDLAPTRERLRHLVDFGRLNDGGLRITVCATDLESGDAVLFDSSRQRIEMDHILASCGFIPEFAPMQIDGRWCGDGGLSLNAPFDPVLQAGDATRLYIIDCYARDGRVPSGLEAAAERKSDLTFGNQTYQRLRPAMEARRLRDAIAGRDPDDLIHLLSYRPGAEEAGPEKSFDLSRQAMAQRWRAGALDMQAAACVQPNGDGLRVVRR